MSGVVQSTTNQPAINPRLLPAIDQLLIAGIKLGPRKKHDPINKILQLVPEWKRGDCWRRIRQLRRTSALATPNAIQGSEQPANNGSSPRPFCRPWRSEEHTSELQSHLNLVCRLLLEKKKIKCKLHTT